MTTAPPAASPSRAFVAAHRAPYLKPPALKPMAWPPPPPRRCHDHPIWLVLRRHAPRRQRRPTTSLLEHCSTRASHATPSGTRPLSPLPHEGSHDRRAFTVQWLDTSDGAFTSNTPRSRIRAPPPSSLALSPVSEHSTPRESPAPPRPRQRSSFASAPRSRGTARPARKHLHMLPSTVPCPRTHAGQPKNGSSFGPPHDTLIVPAPIIPTGASVLTVNPRPPTWTRAPAHQWPSYYNTNTRSRWQRTLPPTRSARSSTQLVSSPHWLVRRAAAPTIRINKTRSLQRSPADT